MFCDQCGQRFFIPEWCYVVQCTLYIRVFRFTSKVKVGISLLCLGSPNSDFEEKRNTLLTVVLCMFCDVAIVHVLWLARTQTCLVIRTHVTIVCNRNKWAHKADLPQTTTNQLLYHQGHNLIISVLDLGRSFQERFKENGEMWNFFLWWEGEWKGVPIHIRKPN